MKKISYFPITVKYDDEEKEVLVEKPEDIRKGVSFKILCLSPKAMKILFSN